MRPIITVDGLSKLYYLGPNSRSSVRPTLREALIGMFRSPISKYSQPEADSDRSLWALKDVSFSVAPGEIVGIIGRNGAGKSTLLKILARITRPTSGAADLYGRTGSLLELGTGFHPDLTGRENVYLNGVLLGMKQREVAKKFDAIIAFSELERFLDTPVKYFSSGMYLRLAFAVAAHFEPEILLLDEVLAVGDAAFQAKCLKKMREASREGRTILFVSHNMSAIQQMCARVFMVREGVLHEGNTPDEAIAEYSDSPSFEAGGDFDLSNHSTRMPGCTPLIQRLTLFGEDGTQTTRFQPDETMVADICVTPDVLIKEPRLTLSIEDSSGRRITTAASYFQDDLLGDIGASSRFRCRLPLRLGTGKYMLSVSIATKERGMIDGLLHAAWFEVIWRDSFGNGEIYHPIYGPVLTTSTWERLE